jgi:CheY-like chemotaxis protein
MRSRPIIIVDDDKDDQESYAEAIKGIGILNHIRFFDACVEALHYLRTTIEQPFIILSDVNLPVMTGMQFREEIQNDEQLSDKSIPFVLISTGGSLSFVKQAYKLGVQGYFLKPNSMEELKKMFSVIFGYWTLSKQLSTAV